MQREDVRQRRGRACRRCSVTGGGVAVRLTDFGSTAEHNTAHLVLKAVHKKESNRGTSSKEKTATNLAPGVAGVSHSHSLTQWMNEDSMSLIHLPYTNF